MRLRVFLSHTVGLVLSEASPFNTCLYKRTHTRACVSNNEMLKCECEKVRENTHVIMPLLGRARMEAEMHADKH